MRRRLLPPFFVLLTFLLIVPPANATSIYVGYLANQHDNTCGTCNYQTSDLTYAGGLAVVAPITGQLFQVSVMLRTTIATKVVIVTYPSGQTPARTLDAGCNSQCGFVNTNQGPWTVQDVEGLSGLATGFNTITLASPVSVISGQWVGILFLISSAGTGWAENCQFTCSNPSINVVAGLEIPSGTTPTVGSQFNSCTTGTCPSGITNFSGVIIGGTFQTIASPSQFVTQCYGNCGSPAVTLTNVNSTRTVNWNQSITLFYQFTSNLNGFIKNVTVKGASFQPNNGLSLSVYLANCQSGQIPFTSQCPGFLQTAGHVTGIFPAKTTITLNLPVTNGQIIGIGLSGDFKPLDLNGTNTNVPIYQTGGRNPGQIQVSSVYDSSSPIGLWSWITGNVITNTGGGPTFTGGGGCLACGLADLVTALGGGLLGGIIAFGIIIALIFGGLLYFTRIHHPASQGGGIKGYAVPMEMLTLIFVIVLIAFSAAGVLPPWIPFLIIALVAWLFTQAIWGHRRGTRTEPMGD